MKLVLAALAAAITLAGGSAAAAPKPQLSATWLDCAITRTFEGGQNSYHRVYVVDETNARPADQLPNGQYQLDDRWQSRMTSSEVVLNYNGSSPASFTEELHINRATLEYFGSSKNQYGQEEQFSGQCHKIQPGLIVQNQF